MKVLLFGGGLQVLALSRSLKDVGFDVDLLGEHIEVAREGRFIDRCFKCDLQTMRIEWFLTFIKDGNYAVVIPTEDPFSDWLSQNKTEVEYNSDVKCAVMDWDVYQLASNKTSLLAFCEKNGFPHPKTRSIESNLSAIAEYVGFPALIKPSHSVGARGIRLVNSLNELEEALPSVIEEYGEVSLQEYICNKDYYYNVMMYRKADGSFGNTCIIKILRFYPIKGGSSSLCLTIENGPLEQMCGNILASLGYVGFADFDVLEKGDGDYRVIEINPRVPASVMASYVSGINYGEMIVEGALGHDLPKYNYQPGKYLRCLGLDIAWFLSSPNRFSAKPSWFKFFGRNIFYMEGGRNDWRAMRASLWEGIKKALNPEFRKAKAGMN